ncbi:MAG: hypothetical protein A2W91_15655 [Bacteroidetes bacterium GWF2_38_335]|nr:MAG: hypothetical protein A2W91_15655 [Bacteroidetes bacterium GWF2_38_335]OFY81527.1 MAG: hypothetical protein A2281_11515 [Bacteroidetes bacterium RIFOXYA12_FULL_38_20]HBS87698.1 pseudouridine synthase [Bacteroidales bacterium]
MPGQEKRKRVIKKDDQPKKRSSVSKRVVRGKSDGKSASKPRKPYSEKTDRVQRPKSDRVVRSKFGDSKSKEERVVRTKSGEVKSKSTRSVKAKKDEGIRLNKYIANAGYCSRREADTFITAGVISINGEVVSELGSKVQPGDVVKFDGREMREERKVYIVLNKPKDYITTVDDPHATKTVLDLVKNACKERVYPVGRLDRNTTGVLLITNDGELAKKLTHPSYNKKKIYHVHVDQNVKKADMVKMTEGINLEDGFVNVDAVSFVDETDKSQVGVEIHSGQNRIVRRIFEYFNYKVLKLDRVYFAGLTKKSLPRGKWRFLTDQEIAMLKMGSYQ